MRTECLLQSGNEYCSKNVNCSFLWVQEIAGTVRMHSFLLTWAKLLTKLPCCRDWFHCITVYYNTFDKPQSRSLFLYLCKLICFYCRLKFCPWILIDLQLQGLNTCLNTYLGLWYQYAYNTQSNLFYLHYKVRQTYVCYCVFVSGHFSP